MITQKDLDKFAEAGCQQPGCTEKHDGTIFLRGRCHSNNRGVDVSYTYGTGVLEISCIACKQVVAVVKVAKK